MPVTPPACHAGEEMSIPIEEFNRRVMALLKKDSLVSIVLDEQFSRSDRAMALNQLLVNTRNETPPPPVGPKLNEC